MRPTPYTFLYLLRLGKDKGGSTVPIGSLKAPGIGALDNTKGNEVR